MSTRKTKPKTPKPTTLSEITGNSDLPEPVYVDDVQGSFTDALNEATIAVAAPPPIKKTAAPKKTAAKTQPKVTKEDPVFGHLLTRTNQEIIAEYERRKSADPFFGRVQSGRDAEDKRLFDEPADDDYDGDQPLEQIKRDHGRPGFSLKAMSNRMIQRSGGTQGYQVVKQDNGDPVKIGDSMTLGEIPIEKAQRRTRAAQKRAENEVREIQENFGERIAKLRQDAHDLGVSVTTPGEKLHNEGGGTFDMGIHVNRGPVPADH